MGPTTDNHWFSKYCPLPNLKQPYPPTMLVHGTADTDVPFEQSRLLADRFASLGVHHELLAVPEGAHRINNLKPEEQNRIYQRAANFLRSECYR